jgi:hypothetical protein
MREIRVALDPPTSYKKETLAVTSQKFDTPETVLNDIPSYMQHWDELHNKGPVCIRHWFLVATFQQEWGHNQSCSADAAAASEAAQSISQGNTAMVPMHDAVCGQKVTLKSALFTISRATNRDGLPVRGQKNPKNPPRHAAAPVKQHVAKSRKKIGPPSDHQMVFGHICDVMSSTIPKSSVGQHLRNRLLGH